MNIYVIILIINAQQDKLVTCSRYILIFSSYLTVEAQNAVVGFLISHSDVNIISQPNLKVQSAAVGTVFVSSWCEHFQIAPLKAQYAVVETL